jgi:hypothetical protein
MNYGAVLQGLGQCWGARQAISPGALLTNAGLSRNEADEFLRRAGEFEGVAQTLEAEGFLPHTDRFESGRLYECLGAESYGQMEISNARRHEESRRLAGQFRAIESRFGARSAEAVRRIAQVCRGVLAEDYHYIGKGHYGVGDGRPDIKLARPILVTGALTKTSVASTATFLGINIFSVASLDALFDGLSLLTGRTPETRFRRASPEETALALLVESAESVDGRCLNANDVKKLLARYANGLLRETVGSQGARVHRYQGVSQDPECIARMAHYSTDYHSWDNDTFIMTPLTKAAEHFDDVNFPPRMASGLINPR